MKNTKKMILLSLLVAIALSLSIMESVIPLPFIAPGAKLGLANIVGLITLVLFGFKEAIVVAVLRSITFALATGSLFSAFYTLSGALLSTIIMFVVYRFSSDYFSLIGVSILGAVSYNIAQICVASIIMRNMKIFSYLPIMLLVSIFTGYFVGLASIFICENMKTNFIKTIE